MRGTGRVYRDKGSWFIDLYIDGERVRKVAGRTKWEAKRVLMDLQPARAARRRPKFLGEVLNTYLASLRVTAKRATVSFAACHAGHLEKHFGANRDVRELTKTDLDSFKAARLIKVKRASVNGSLRILRAALKHSDIDVPVKMMKETMKLPRVLTPADVDRLIELANPPIDLIILTAALAGLRHAEILHLQRRDVDLVGGNLEVRAKDGIWTPKTHVERSVPLHDDLVEAFARHLDTLADSSPAAWVFLGLDGGPRGPVSGPVREVFKAAGLYNPDAKPGLHSLRRTWATGLLDFADIETVKQLGGWNNLTTVQRYITSSDERKRSAISKLRRRR